MQNELFTSRERIRRWKAFSGIFHLLSVTLLVLVSLLLLPRWGGKGVAQSTTELTERQSMRQLLLEALDKIARYQKYYRELHGRYARDLSRLSLPLQLASGTMEELRRHYEISVLELQPNRFLVLATGTSGTDRVTIDERHRLNANFVLPPPSRAYLVEEADRLLALRASGGTPEEGLYLRYWKLNSSDDVFFAVGQRNPVLGERRELEADRSPATLFTAIGERLKTHFGAAKGGAPEKIVSPFKEMLEAHDVNDWLTAARLAQHVYRREKGHYARKWEELDGVSDYRFAERMKVAKNVRVQPIEVVDQGFRLTIEGTSGELMGEQFVVDHAGEVRQVRYTEALIQQLQDTTSLLENTFHFQINPVNEDPAQRAQP